MGRARDSQRSKVYRAEGFLQKKGPRYETVAEMQAYVDKLTQSAWFRRRWPRLARNGIEVRDGRGRRIACAQTSWGRAIIKMPLWSRSEAVILHEVAHHCTDEGYGTAMDIPWHGWQFASTLHELVAHKMGKEIGDDLKKSFRECKVKFRAPRKKRPLTDVEKEVLRERMAVARAAKAAKVDSGEVHA
jgi:putative metallohydrolase (TIGR04338 family)